MRNSDWEIIAPKSDVIDKTDGSELARAFNHLWEKYIEQEPKTGHWIKAQKRGITSYSDAYAECDRCHDEQGYEPTYMGWWMKYCPNCGSYNGG